jgi:UDP-glucose 4-epimerase
MKNCIVTGGAGFIGSHLVEALLARGDRVSVVDDESTGTIDNLAAVLNHPRLSYTKGTVADEELVCRLVADADEVYHLAAAVGVQLIAQSPIHTIETNIYTTELLLRQLGQRVAAGRNVKFFMTSTSEVYGKNPKPRWTEEDDLLFGPTTRPRWSYGASKAIDEFLALAYWRERNLPAVVGRLFNVVGPRQTGAYGMVLPRLIDAALAGGPLLVHDDGQQQRCFAHVGDVVRMILALMACPAAVGGVCNIGSDQPVSILDLAQRVIAAVDPSLTVEFISYIQAYGEDFEDCRRRVPDLTKLRTLTGLRAEHGLDDIICELVAWKRENKKNTTETRSKERN